MQLLGKGLVPDHEDRQQSKRMGLIRNNKRSTVLDLDSYREKKEHEWLSDGWSTLEFETGQQKEHEEIDLELIPD